MAIYHLESKVISRGTGRSAVAAAAYMSCSKIMNDYDGVRHDYTRKQGLVWERVFLPEYAPAKWQDRSILWNAVEENEKTKDSRLAREFVAALPIELGRNGWITLLTEFIQEQFVANGMCADVCIHDTDGRNPHAHIMLTVRPLDKAGRWQHKTEKEYLCVRNGVERGFTAAEFKAAQADRWEKQYQYKVGKKKVYLPPSEAEAHGYNRVSKYPKSTKYGRQDPTAARWNSEEQLALWREAWANVVNRHLELGGLEDRVDHRSHSERGLDEQPTIHEGVTARVMEKKGIVSDRCEINRQIRRDNALLRELKAAVKKLTRAVLDTIPRVAEALEALRGNMLIFQYKLSRVRADKGGMEHDLSAVRFGREQYLSLAAKIKDKSRERKELLDEKRRTPKIYFLKHNDLTQRIAGVTEELEELRSERSSLLARMQRENDSGVSEFDRDISVMETALKKMEAQEEKYVTQTDAALAEYRAVNEKADSLDPVALYEKRREIRPEIERRNEGQIRETEGRRFSPASWSRAISRVNDLLGDKDEWYKVWRIQREREREARRGTRERGRKLIDKDRER